MRTIAVLGLWQRQIVNDPKAFAPGNRRYIKVALTVVKYIRLTYATLKGHGLDFIIDSLHTLMWSAFAV